MSEVERSKLSHSVKQKSTFAVRRIQTGVSLIEVLAALFILVFGSLAIVHLQTASALSVSSSADHFKINELGHLVIEQLKSDRERASSGGYNTVFDDEKAPASAAADIALKINEWKSTMSRSTPLGRVKIECDNSECNVGLQWYEHSYEVEPEQIYNIKMPI